MPVWTTLNGNFQDIGNVTLSENLRDNIIAFYEWALLNIGAFFNVRIPTSGAYGGNQHILRLSEDPNYQVGQVWESFRSEWVWQSGLEYRAQPISITGVYINSNFYPIGTGYAINYPQGRVIFASPVPTNATVSLEYSYRYYTFTNIDAPWVREVMFNSFRVDDPQFKQFGSGQWSIPAEMRVQLPAVAVEMVPRRTHIGYEIGGGTLTRQDVLFHIFAETDTDRSRIMDIIDAQLNKTLYGFDKNKINNANAYPLDFNGNLVSGALMYPQLVDPASPYAWRKYTVMVSRFQEQENRLPLYMGSVRQTVELNTPEIT